MKNTGNFVARKLAIMDGDEERLPGIDVLNFAPPIKTTGVRPVLFPCIAST
jgi:hypothetical protein